MERRNVQVGVVAFQGGIEEHILVGERLGVAVKRVLSLQDAKDLTHLIIPGGESTVIGHHMVSTGLDAFCEKQNEKGNLKLWGTCAGAILLGKKASPYSLDCIDVDLERNAYGRQMDSFSTLISVQGGEGNIPAVFIRAPRIVRVGKGVRILASYEGEPILCRNENVLISTFHPELTESSTMHEYFFSQF